MARAIRCRSWCAAPTLPLVLLDHYNECLVYLNASDQKSGRAGSVPLNQPAWQALLSRARYRAEHCPASPWVFCDKQGRRIANVRKGFGLAVTRAGLSNVHPHDVRRSFGN